MQERSQAVCKGARCRGMSHSRHGGWPAGIIRRVAGVLLAALVLGATLFYVGLQLTFPSYG